MPIVIDALDAVGKGMLGITSQTYYTVYRGEILTLCGTSLPRLVHSVVVVKLSELIMCS